MKKPLRDFRGKKLKKYVLRLCGKGLFPPFKLNLVDREGEEKS